jgi:DNA-binding NarL/FixJ family response regulator
MILLASPSKILCRRWRNALAGSFPLHQVDNRKSLLHSLRELQPKVLFLDHSEKHFGQTGPVCKIINAAVSTRVVVLVDQPRENEAVEFIKAGAKGYGAANIGAPLLCKAARVVSGGEFWIGRKLLPVLFDELVRAAGASTASIPRPSDRPLTVNGFKGLSPREREITSLVASGQQNKCISNKLRISEKTVKSHLTTIFRKLNVDGRTQLALAVIGTPQRQALSDHA